MCVDLRNTGQIFEGNEACFFISKLVSFILSEKTSQKKSLFPHNNLPQQNILPDEHISPNRS